MAEKIIGYGHPILREVCTEITDFSRQSKVTIDKLMDTTSISQTIVGLAAPQIGITTRAFIMRIGNDFVPMINPIITKQKYTQRFDEGCMSIPGLFAKTEIRADIIDIEYYQVLGEKKKMRLRGFDSVIFQHEYDHLNGILFVDHLTPERKEAIADKLSDIASGVYDKHKYQYDIVFNELKPE